MQRVAALADLAPDRLTPVEIDGASVVLIRTEDGVLAFGGECPHAGAALAEGALCDGHIICPWHKATFAVSDGRLLEPPALRGLERYDVELQGDEVWVAARPAPVQVAAQAPGVPTMDMIALVVGGGAAGAAGVAALREFGYCGRIILVAREPGLPYDRTSLSKFVLSGDMKVEDIPPLLEADFFARHAVEPITAEIVRLDAAQRVAHLDNGTAMHYTMALATPGATAKRLHLDGADLQNIFTLRSAADAASICADLQAGTRVVIVGSSFIGLEVASSLRARDLAVTIIAQEEIPFLRQFGSAIGQMFKALHEENGVRFVSKSPLARFEGDGGKVRSAVLEDGAVLPADLVIIGVGVQPATDFLQGVDRTEDGGIKVDRGMRAAEGLYVAGDAASFPFGETLLRIEHWRVAQQHARVAARNMLGETAEYDAVPFFWTYHYGRRFEYLGHASEWDEVVVDGSLAAQNFLAFLVSGGMVAAVVACQRERDTARLADRMRHPLAVDEARRLITDRS